MARQAGRLLGALGFALAFLAMGVGGFFLWKLQERQRAALARLAETQAQLSQSEQTLAMLEAERQKLADSYETLRGRWSASDEELGRLKTAAGRMTKDLATVATERAGIAKDLERSRQEMAEIHARVDVLQSELTASDAREAELQVQLKEAASASLTPAEVEQLGLALAQSQDEQEHLRAKLIELSRAYESAAVAPLTPDPSSDLSDAGQARDQRSAADAADALAGDDIGKTEAAKHRRLGEAYLASQRYPEAADAFERSLAYVDDPAVHTHLVFLYSRILHNPQKAVFHRARAPDKVDATTESLRTAAGTHGLPRTSRKAVWEWLTK